MTFRHASNEWNHSLITKLLLDEPMMKIAKPLVYVASVIHFLTSVANGGARSRVRGGGAPRKEPRARWKWWHLWAAQLGLVSPQWMDGCDLLRTHALQVERAPWLILRPSLLAVSYFPRRKGVWIISLRLVLLWRFVLRVVVRDWEEIDTCSYESVFFFSYLLAGCSSSETKRGERRIKEGLIIFVSVLALSVVVNGNKSVVVWVTASLDFLLWGNKACEMLCRRCLSGLLFSLIFHFSF